MVPDSTEDATGAFRSGLLLATLTTLAAAVALTPQALGARPERAPASVSAAQDAPRPSAAARSARRELRSRLGPLGLLASDPRSGGVRVLARLDGFLTRPSARDGAEIVRAYVRDRADVFGLDPGDLAALDMVRRHRDLAGVEHIVWAQTHRGVPAVDTALRAALTPDGRVVNVTGGAAPDLTLPTTVPAVSAAEAHAVAAAGLVPPPEVRSAGSGPTRPTEFENGDRAALAIFGRRLVWRVFVRVSSTAYYDALVDARTAAPLRRENRVKFQTSSVRGFPNHPGAPFGGVLVDDLPPMTQPVTRLAGPNAHAFVDSADQVPGSGPTVVIDPPGQETSPSNGNDFIYGFTTVANCAPPCSSWNPAQGGSWTVNANHAATQLYFHVNRFHDHLAAAPIGFTTGNFENADRVVAQAMDGAAGPGNLPDANHVNNANMLTLEDGFPGLMQMYLWDPSRDPSVRAVDGSDDASIVYHEYTHGLNSRLVTDAQGLGALGSIQSGAIDEGQADWYSADFLHAQSLEDDALGQGDVVVGSYAVPGGIRFQPLDCEAPPAPVAAGCPPPPGGAGAGGYTYGDFGRVVGGPEVHADGEIWAQTLWDLRNAVGGVAARGLVTSAMRLVPPEPSFLDMRNAIVQADTIAGGAHRAAIWQTFARRGMGWFASTADAADRAPLEDFSPEPPAGSEGTLTGTVRDAASGAPLAGARVAVGGHDTGLGPDFSATTAADGTYAIGGVPQGTYRTLLVEAPGYDRAVETGVAVPGTRDVALRRNHALASGGAQIASFTGPDYTSFGCGPAGLIDGGGGTVWGTDAPGNPPGSGPKEIVVRLPGAITLGEIRIDPTAGCGDDDSSSLGPFQVEVSGDGVTFTPVASGSFGSADVGRENVVPLTSTPSGVRYVRLRALDSQSVDGTGASFMDVAELEVYEAPAQAPASPAPVAAPPAPAADSARPAAPGALRFLTRRVRARRDGSFVWRVAGPAGARGSVTFTALLPRSGRRAVRLWLASRRFTIPRSGRLALRVRPSRRALARMRRLRAVRVLAAVRLAGERPRSSTFRLTLRR